jgi:hypothetical protein
LSGFVIDTALENDPDHYDPKTFYDIHDAFCPLCPRTDRDGDMEIIPRKQWVLTPPVRVMLYVELFLPARSDEGLKSWLAEIVRGNIRFVKELQKFILHASLKPLPNSRRVTAFPDLQYFVEDAITMIRILAQSTDRVPIGYSANPRTQFMEQRWPSWRERWAGRPGCDTYHVLDAYTCALCDAIFGLWPAKGNKGKELFHDNEPGCQHRCVAQMFSRINSGFFEGFIRDRHLLDAEYIEANGPFRFIETNRLDQHLLITRDNKILFFSDWKRWTGLCYHRVLRDNADNLFSNLINYSRGRRERSSQYGHACSHISSDIAASIRLFFHQPKKEQSPERKLFRMRWLHSVQHVLSELMHSVPSIHLPFMTPSRNAIAERIGLKLPVGVAFEEIAAQIEVEDHFGSSWDLYPFLDRARQLETTLRTWKPKTVLQLRYPGYGGVNPVELYGFYFGAGFGVIAFIALAVSVAQTYASFKALS